jgi:DNA-3-methyladenine glycosylase
MFGRRGYVYIYVIYTHCLINVASGEIGCPEAVLIRGKLTKFLGIVKEVYGRAMFEYPLLLLKEKKLELLGWVQG